MTLKLEAGKKYRTRGGDEVEVLRAGLNTCGDTIVGVLTRDDGTQKGKTWQSDGTYYGDDDPSHLDLISEILPKRVVWLNVYGDVHPCYYHPSREEADRGASDGRRIACIRLEFEEGQFDE